MNSINGKKILFVSPKYFGYEVEIKKKLESFGAKVDYYDERPSNASLIKASIRINRNIISKIIHDHYNVIIEKNRTEKYDYVFFIHLETPFADILEKLRNCNPTAQYILYMWDSMLHRPNTYELTKYFNRVYTFDRSDSIKYNFNFRPLFYLDEYCKSDDVIPNFDLVFIGTVHSDRYRIIKEISKQCKNLNLTFNKFLFMHNKLLFYKMKFSSLYNLGADINEISFNSLNKFEVIRLLQQAKTVIDIQHPENLGLTMRTLEVLGLKRKLITTNNDIVNYDFYNDNNVLVINRENPMLDKDFFEKECISVQREAYNKYSINSWIEDIFNS